MLLLGLTGCLPKAHIQVLEPAEVALPAHVRTLAVVDRSKASDVGQGVLGVLEGAITGEAIGADTEGRRASTAALVQVLAASPRFEVVQPIADRDAVGSTLFAKVLDHGTVAALCDGWRVDALVALEAFDSDSTLHADRSVDDEGRVTWTAERSTTVLTAWRVYDRAAPALLDDVRDERFVDTWTQRGDTKGEAIGALPSQVDTVASVAAQAGDAYARRIAPNYVLVSRAYFGGGHDGLKAGKLAAKRADWAAAAERWSALTDHPDPKVAGRAEFNLALAHELDGRLDAAMAHADRADELLGKARTRRYAAELRYRRGQRAEVRDQMAPVSGPSDGEPGEDTPPGRRADR